MDAEQPPVITNGGGSGASGGNGGDGGNGGGGGSDGGDGGDGGGEGDHGASVKSAVVQEPHQTSQVAVPRGGDEESSDMKSAQ